MWVIQDKTTKLYMPKFGRGLDTFNEKTCIYHDFEKATQRKRNQNGFHRRRLEVREYNGEVPHVPIFDIG